MAKLSSAGNIESRPENEKVLLQSVVYSMHIITYSALAARSTAGQPPVGGWPTH
jgi:hypothetical protein